MNKFIVGVFSFLLLTGCSAAVPATQAYVMEREMVASYQEYQVQRLAAIEKVVIEEPVKTMEKEEAIRRKRTAKVNKPVKQVKIEKAKIDKPKKVVAAKKPVKKIDKPKKVVVIKKPAKKIVTSVKKPIKAKIKKPLEKISVKKKVVVRKPVQKKVVKKVVKAPTTKVFQLSFYSELPEHNGGYTVTSQGEKLSSLDHVVASNYYPIGTRIYLKGFGIVRVADRGGSDFNSSRRLDVLVPRRSGESKSAYIARVWDKGRISVSGYIVK